MKRKLRYILRKLRTISLFALVPSLLITYGTAGWWWYQPIGWGLAVFGVSFAVFALIGVTASIHDDYSIGVYAYRRKPW